MTETTPAIPPETVALPGGGRMPLLGFGTWQLKGDEALRATATALEAGYRHLDTATVYGNEAEVGRALAESGVPREHVFITTKCPPDHAGKERDTLRRSLDLLGTDHVDLWLVHWPGHDEGDVDLWRGFIEARDAGLVRDIGVSNYSAAQIDAVTETSGVAPAVNQIRWSPLLYDAEVVAEHAKRGVVLEGYSALKGGTLDHPTITAIAERLGRTTAQVIVRWHVQHGTVVIPRSSKPDRVRANADVEGFALTDADMAAIDALGGTDG